MPSDPPLIPDKEVNVHLENKGFINDQMMEFRS